VHSDLRLADLTTLRLGGPAREITEPASESELVAQIAELDRTGLPLLLVGGGSNLVVADEGFDGTVVRILTRGVDEREGSDSVLVTVAAGEPWDEFVLRVVESGLAGVEALSGIPGLTGATPIQNVGAYGQEVAQTIAEVRVLDRPSGRVRTLVPSECGFGYRTSALRGSSRYVVLATTFRLRRSQESEPVGYSELAHVLGVDTGVSAPLAEVRAAVLELRRSKGMVLDEGDPDTMSAGSFFTNPVLSEQAAQGLPPGAPRYPAGGGQTKTSAAWLIEQAGFARGYGPGRARISTKHTLALTNLGGATTAELLALAREVRDRVRERFGIELTPEPVLVGCSL
jgi:UDP-N-acetylmuramate dehydrogenase